MAKDNPQPPVPPTESQPEAPSGFFVQRIFGPDGQLDVDVQIVGEAKITEAHTVLALGLRMVDSKLNL